MVSSQPVWVVANAPTRDAQCTELEMLGATRLVSDGCARRVPAATCAALPESSFANAASLEGMRNRPIDSPTFARLRTAQPSALATPSRLGERLGHPAVADRHQHTTTAAAHARHTSRPRNSTTSSKLSQKTHPGLCALSTSLSSSRKNSSGVPVAPERGARLGRDHDAP